MRVLNTLGWSLACLCAIGCSGSRSGGGGSGGYVGPGGMTSTPVDPFTLSSRDGTTVRDPINGVLAGYALDRWRNPLVEVTIEIIDLNETTPSSGKRARITTTTDRSGQYKFEGLNPSHQYQLIARTREGNRQLFGTALASPPNTRVPLFLSDDYTGADPRSAAKDEEKAAPTTTRDRTNSIGPAATIGPPTKILNNPEPIPTHSVPGSGTPPLPEDRSRSIRDGFSRDPITTIPGPASVPQPVIPPTPRPNPTPTPATGAVGGIQANLGMPEGPSPDLPAVPVTVPMCTLVGKRLMNMALYTHEGLPWIYSRDRNRSTRVVLLDFWSSTCTPCLSTLPKLNEFQQHYGPHGLQVVGIAHEEATWAKASADVNGARVRHNVKFTTLIAGDGNGGKCPVETQFDITARPTLVLLDETGTIVWKKVGILDPQSKLELEHVIRKKLGLPTQ